MAREQGTKPIAQNKKARHDYHIEDTWEAGIVLVGTEVKSLRQGRASLVDGFAEVDNGEVWLHQVHIPEYSQGTWTNHSARRKRKLLLNRAEIHKIERKVADHPEVVRVDQVRRQLVDDRVQPTEVRTGTTRILRGLHREEMDGGECDGPVVGGREGQPVVVEVPAQ